MHGICLVKKPVTLIFTEESRMALKSFAKERKVRRRSRLRPLNHQKKLGPNSCHKNNKRKRGQGG